ncbi:iron complex transport system ATP-binding protein [Alkalispirochaeta americana]|uniref:Iron complex transport system ATP-binding protein n=1 Tax=Alkalispirochaeta americana TaxID=159291 RepID=A0A1N6TMF9_9SPIO|nr:ABC transporter ATP-binding protein [Alkalispirochaeta americana]SIQ54525.1 iron complex transport system ATP-binding protein [Alkalispirochaeta americana]
MKSSDHPGVSPHPAVSLKDVSFRYPRAAEEVLQDITLSVTEGTITAILGPNGVGKTTLLNILLGWLLPEKGEVSLFGRRSRAISRREMGQTISLVPQDEHVPFEYTLLDYVLLGRAPYLSPLQTPRPADARIAREALERVGLAARRNHPVANTSGGEKQLALVARSLAQEPRILLMDEPTAHLDLRNKRRTADLVKALQTEGVTVIFTTHDPEFAAAAADRLILLQGGRLLDEGPVDQVMTTENLGRVFSLDLVVHHFAGRPVVVW